MVAVEPPSTAAGSPTEPPAPPQAEAPTPVAGDGAAGGGPGASPVVEPRPVNEPPSLATLALFLAAAVPILLLFPYSLLGRWSGLARLLAMQAAVLVPTLVWAWRSGYRPSRLLRLAPAPSARILGLGGAAGLAAMVAGAGLHGLTRAALPRSLLEQFDVRRALALEPWSPWLLLLVAAIVPATCEELAFRGGLQSGLAGRRSPRRAIALSSLVFALYHLDPVRFPGVLLLGVVYGWLAWATGSVWPSMLAHALNNGLAVIGLLASPGAEPAGDELVTRPADAALVLATGVGLLGLVVAAAGRWLPPAPEAASFLTARGAAPGGVEPTGAPPAPPSGAGT